MVALIGASGSGKSTLIRSIAGLIPIDAGGKGARSAGGSASSASRCRADGRICGAAEAARPRRRRLPAVQPGAAPVGLTNVCLGLLGQIPRWRGTLARASARREMNAAMQALQRVGIAEHALKRGSELSGGQQQRAAIARTLVQGAEHSDRRRAYSVARSEFGAPRDGYPGRAEPRGRDHRARLAASGGVRAELIARARSRCATARRLRRAVQRTDPGLPQRAVRRRKRGAVPAGPRARRRLRPPNGQRPMHTSRASRTGRAYAVSWPRRAETPTERPCCRDTGSDHTATTAHCRQGVSKHASQIVGRIGSPWLDGGGHTRAGRHERNQLRHHLDRSPAPISRRSGIPSWPTCRRSTGLKINAFFASDYAGVIEGMRFKKVQIAWFGNKSAMEAVDRAEGEVFAQTVAKTASAGYYVAHHRAQGQPVPETRRRAEVRQVARFRHRRSEFDVGLPGARRPLSSLPRTSIPRRASRRCAAPTTRPTRSPSPTSWCSGRPTTAKTSSA